MKKNHFFFVYIKNSITFVANYWCGSSVWLEYRPVTPGVAGSSPVHTAKSTKQKSFGLYKFDWFYNEIQEST